MGAVLTIASFIFFGNVLGLGFGLAIGLAVYLLTLGWDD